MSLRLFLLAAASPLCVAAGIARAETAISTTVTTPLTTATAASGARDDIRVTLTGIVKPPGGAAVTLNSNNSVNIEGGVTLQDASNATGLLVLGGATGEVKLSGGITVDETTEAKDTDNDGDIDGPFAAGTGRYGVRLTGAQPFHGSIVRTGGAISVEGNDSAGVSLEAALEGALRSGGSTTVVGDRSFGLHAMSTVGGDVTVTGTVSVLGKDAVGVALDDNVGGRLVLGHSVTVTGYRSVNRPADAAVAKLDADDLLQGGPAVRVAGDVAGGVLVDAPPPDLSASDTDEDKDGVPDAQETTGTLSVYGAAPALLVGSGSRAVRLGPAGTGADASGLVIKGVVQSDGVYDGVASTGVQLGGLGGAVVVDAGVRVGGSITAVAAKADATALRLGAGASVPSLANAGAIRATAAATDPVNVRAVRIDAGAAVTDLTNTGAITAGIAGSKGSATAVLDAAGSLRTLSNTNRIAAAITPATATTAVSGQAVALDLRANTAGVAVRQLANASATITPAIVGDVLFGSGAARLDLLAGTLDGAVAFGSGADSLKIDGGARLTGALTDAGGGLAVDIVKGRLTPTNVQTVALSSLSLGAAGELVMTLDPAAGTATRFDVQGAAALAAGAKVGLRFATKLTAPASFTLIKAGSLTSGGLDSSLLGSTPWLYRSTVRVDAAQNAVIADVRRRT
ncbi:MAG TPA: autotransporter domain-containing protein, partial [Phenylobacterium sp.]|nr:autotransporter domain-containing protein [Phenylobacterium sp.]